MTKTKEVDNFEKYLKESGKSESTIKNYLSDLRKYFDYAPTKGGAAGSKPVKKAVEKYISHLETSGLSKPTINRRIQTLRAYYQSLIDAGELDSNPMDGIKPKKIARQNDTKWLTDDQVKRIFKAIDNSNHTPAKKSLHRAIISVMVNSGLRVQEVVDLKISDIDFDKGIISVTGKGDKFRKVPVNKSTAKRIMHWFRYRDKEGGYVFQTERSPHMTVRAVQHITKRLSQDLPFDFTVHQLRHTALKNIADSTGKIEIVASVAGHEHIQTSRRYIEPSIEEISKAMKDNEYD